MLKKNHPWRWHTQLCKKNISPPARDRRDICSINRSESLRGYRNDMHPGLLREKEIMGNEELIET